MKNIAFGHFARLLSPIRLSTLGVICLAVVAVILVGAERGWLFSATRGSPPRIEMERELDLGRADLNRPRINRFNVTNSGGQPLIIRSAKTSCRCQGVFHETFEGNQEEVRDLAVHPGETAVLGISFVATGSLGVQTGISVDLETNDPIEPVAHFGLVYTPSAPIYSIPPVVRFGTVSVAQSAEATVDVFDDGRASRVNWAGVASLNPGPYSVRFTPAAAKQDANYSRPVLVGSLTVSRQPSAQPAEIDEPVVVISGGQEVFRLPVSGKVVNDFELTPATLTFPRQSSSGLIYESVILCRSNHDKAFSIKTIKILEDFEVMYSTAGQQSCHQMKVVYVGKHSLTTPRKDEIVFEVNSEGNTATLRLAVSTADGIIANEK
ncbi:DUF1573 domain-containing protein [Fimbriiglobus ruber]|uniref:DUF1573 domain-containing protein n=1 Tax=Fimbriiglobus ruber TaxID=1908690 RepID=UPI000B4A7816|nr:DUF1573 domain-containing protein [Fimbriiglobus ruber]